MSHKAALANPARPVTRNGLPTATAQEARGAIHRRWPWHAEGWEAQLDGRAACWHHYLGREVPLDRCRDAALHFVGYATVDALVADYPDSARARRINPSGEPGELSLNHLPARWRAWMVEEDMARTMQDRDEALRALLAFMYRENASDLHVSFNPYRVKNIVNTEFALRHGGVLQRHPISHAGAVALLTSTGCPITCEGVKSGYPAYLHMPTGRVRVQGNLLDPGPGVFLIARSLFDSPQEPEEEPRHMDTVKPFLDALLAEHRQSRVPGLPEGAPERHRSLRA